MIVVRKKYIIFSLIAFFALIVVFFGSYINSDFASNDYPIGQVQKVSTNTVNKSNVFEQIRVERENKRKEIISKLNDTINNVAIDEII